MPPSIALGGPIATQRVSATGRASASLARATSETSRQRQLWSHARRGPNSRSAVRQARRGPGEPFGAGAVLATTPLELRATLRRLSGADLNVVHVRRAVGSGETVSPAPNCAWSTNCPETKPIRRPGFQNDWPHRPLNLGSLKIVCLDGTVDCVALYFKELASTHLSEPVIRQLGRKGDQAANHGPGSCANSK